MTSPTEVNVTDLDRTIAATVTALYKGRGLNRYDLADALGCSYQTVVTRTQGKSVWTMYEVYTLAAYFDVRVGDLTHGLSGVFGTAENTPRRNVRRLPRRDSNTQPAGYEQLHHLIAA